MAHWAQLDEDNVVIQVTVGSNEDADEGYAWLIRTHGGTWVKTSYNTRGGEHILGGTPFRKNYAAPGFVYDEERDAFIPPRPDYFIGDIILNEDTCLWEPAIKDTSPPGTTPIDTNLL